MERGHRKTGCRERREQRLCPWERRHAKSRFHGRSDKAFPWIGQKRCPGVPHQGHHGTGPEKIQHLRDAAAFIELVQGKDSLGWEAVMLQQDARMPGVLGEDLISLAKEAERPQGDVVEVPDRGRAKIQAAWESRGRVLSCRSSSSP